MRNNMINIMNHDNLDFLSIGHFALYLSIRYSMGNHRTYLNK